MLVVLQSRFTNSMKVEMRGGKGKRIPLSENHNELSIALEITKDWSIGVRVRVSSK